MATVDTFRPISDNQLLAKKPHQSLKKGFTWKKKQFLPPQSVRPIKSTGDPCDFLERNKIRFLPKVFIEMSDIFLLDFLYLTEALKKVERAEVEIMKLEVFNYSSLFLTLCRIFFVTNRPLPKSRLI